MKINLPAGSQQTGLNWLLTITMWPAKTAVVKATLSFIVIVVIVLLVVLQKSEPLFCSLAHADSALNASDQCINNSVYFAEKRKRC